MCSLVEGDPPQPALIPNPLGESLTLAKMVEDLPELAERKERIAKLHPEIDALFDCFAALGDMCKGRERLLEAHNRFPAGRACSSLRPGLTEVGEGLVPDFAPKGMVGEAIDVVDQPVAIQLFDCLHDLNVESPSS